jgi:hypothetical protein
MTELDDFDKCVLWHIIFCMHSKGEFPTARKLIVEVKLMTVNGQC